MHPGEKQYADLVSLKQQQFEMASKQIKGALKNADPSKCKMLEGLADKLEQTAKELKNSYVYNLPKWQEFIDKAQTSVDKIENNPEEISKKLSEQGGMDRKELKEFINDAYDHLDEVKEQYQEMKTKANDLMSKGNTAIKFYKAAMQSKPNKGKEEVSELSESSENDNRPKMR